jgi:hypothetical protein
MAEEKVNLVKDGYNKRDYLKTIDTSFRELGVTTVAQDLEQETTVEDFFRLYNELFYDIPPRGDTNSHEYLVIQSSEYINFERDLEEIEALRQEIAELREELLSTQLENIELSAGITPSGTRKPLPGESKKDFIARTSKEARERAGDNNTGQ